MRVVVSLTVAAALALTPACKQPDEVASEQRAQVREPEALVIAPAPAAPITVSLIEPGTEPRQLLRYTSQAPARKLRLSSLALRDHGEPDDVILALDLNWRGVATEGGQLRYLFDVFRANSGAGMDAREALALEPEDARRQGMVASMETVENLFAGAAGQAVGDVTGIERLTRTKGSNLNPEPLDMLDVFVVPLPSEAVGVGASWTSSVRADLNPPPEPGLRSLLKPNGTSVWATFSRNYRLTALDGDVATIAFEATTTIERAEPAGDWRELSSGELELRLADPLAWSGRVVISHPDDTPVNVGSERRHAFELAPLPAE